MIYTNRKNGNARFGRILSISGTILALLFLLTGNISVSAMNNSTSPQHATLSEITVSRAISDEGSAVNSKMQFVETTFAAGTETRTGRDQTTITTGKDATISTSFEVPGNENLNLGADEDIYSSYDGGDGQTGFFPFRILIEFDLTGIDADAEITSALMKMNYHYSRDQGGNEGTVSVPLTLKAHRVTRSWVEGTGTFTAGTQDGATWNTYDGSNAWSSAGGE